MRIKKNSVVKLEFSASIGNEELQATTKPKLILVGFERDLPPGLEDALIDCEPGEPFTVQLHNAFGAYDPNQRVTVHQRELPSQSSGQHLEIGSKFSAQNPDGQALEARVIDIQGDQVTVDMNHPRAGQTLELRIHIHAVRMADAFELEHGHAHGEGGVQHHHH
jgi:FKBP-type peptidyl-prolyl cis-trans isomerase SlyD